MFNVDKVKKYNVRGIITIVIGSVVFIVSLANLIWAVTVEISWGTVVGYSFLTVVCGYFCFLGYRMLKS